MLLVFLFLLLLLPLPLSVHPEDLSELSANPAGLSGSFGLFGLSGFSGLFSLSGFLVSLVFRSGNQKNDINQKDQFRLSVLAGLDRESLQPQQSHESLRPRPTD